MSEATRAKSPGVPFIQIVGMRHKVVHDYMDVDLDIVYSVVTNDVPALIAELEKVVPPEA